MSCCCNAILNLCNVPVCGTLKLDQPADGSESGVENIYTLVLDFFETTVTLVGLQVEEEPIKFDVSKLNESFQYTGQVFDSAGELVPIVVGDTTYDCIKFKTVISTYAVTATAVPPVLNIPGTVVIESVVDEWLSITGTSEIVTGVTAGSNTITSNAFTGVRVMMIRGNVPIPGGDPGDGSNYCTKIEGSDFISLSKPLEAGEFIRIQTIPQ